MCIIAMVKENVSLNEQITEWFDNCIKSNSDGFGISYIKDSEVQIYKTLDINQYTNEVKRIFAEHPESKKMLHFRKQSVGQIDVINCHPFKVGEYSIAHNGTVNSFGDTITSDTRDLAQQIHAANPALLENEGFLRILSSATKSRFCIMKPNNSCKILGDWEYEAETGIYFSNTFYKIPREAPKPYADYYNSRRNYARNYAGYDYDEYDEGMWVSAVANETESQRVTAQTPIVQLCSVCSIELIGPSEETTGKCYNCQSY